MATHSSILAWKFPWAKEPGRLHPWGCRESDMTEWAHTHTHTYTHTAIIQEEFKYYQHLINI